MVRNGYVLSWKLATKIGPIRVWQPCANNRQERERYGYIWVVGIYCDVCLGDERSCILVVIGATETGEKELLTIQDGYRESKLFWLEALRDLKNRGLSRSPALATGNGALGFWAAADEEFFGMRRQRCWIHKTANVLDKMPKGVKDKAKQRIHDMYRAETKEEALKVYDELLHLYQAKYPQACACLAKDREDLFAFYDFPVEHWVHPRTINPIESTFSHSSFAYRAHEKGWFLTARP